MWPKHEVITPQAVASATFTAPPPLSGMTYTEAIDHNHDNNGSHTHFVYAHPKTNVPVSIAWTESARAAWRVAHAVHAHAAGTPAAKFAILAVSDTISYTTVANGIIRAGFEAFLVSHRVSAPVVAQMLQKRGTTHVFVSRDPAMQAVAKGAVEVLGEGKVKVLQMPLFEEMYTNEPVERPPVVVPTLDDIAIVLHSSGSTSVPKIVPYPHRSLNIIAIYPSISTMDHCMTVGWHVLPMFHFLGASGMVAAAWTGTTISVYPPQFPPVSATPDSALAHLVHTKAEAVILPPVILEALMAHKPAETIEVLKNMKAVVFGGGPLNQGIGDAMHNAGVKLGVLYGMTEVLSISVFLPTLVDGAPWDYLHVHKGHNIHFRDLENGTHEPIIMETEWHKNNLNNVEINGVKGYTTNDVVIRHPTFPNAIKVIGRIDDQIILSTGEKTNPIPLEGILMEDSRIHQVVSFGRGRPHGGVIIQPRPGFAFDGRDVTKLREFRELIADTIRKVNDYVPSHSRIMKEMILVTSPDRPFALTQKGTPQRPDALNKYEVDIQAAYEAFELSAESIFTPPDVWTGETSLEFVRMIVHQSITSNPSDDADLFQHGCDSLRAAWIRNAIANSIDAEAAKRISREVVYEHPTILKLSAAVLIGVSGSSGGVTATELKIAEIEGLLSTYGTNFAAHTGTLPLPAKKTYLVTGTTGGLGSHLLDQLIADPNVERVYAVNRAANGGDTIETKHVKVFRDRGLDVPNLHHSLESGRIKIILADTSAHKLGLSDELYEELANSVTHIVHNAWPVNFKYAIATFEPAIRGHRNLIDLALASPFVDPTKFLFISSISVARLVNPGELTPEAYIDNASDVVGFGYGESKWIGETLLRRAAEVTPMKPVSVRVGQLSGGGNGNWNASDWVPNIVRTSKALGAAPDVPGDTISWIRLNEATATLLELLDLSKQPVLQLLHPKPVSWTSIFDAVSKELNVPLVPIKEWLAALEEVALTATAADEQNIPGLKLMGYLRALGGGGGEGLEEFHGFEDLDTKCAQATSATMRAMKPMDTEDVGKWIGYWRAAGYL